MLIIGSNVLYEVNYTDSDWSGDRKRPYGRFHQLRKPNRVVPSPVLSSVPALAQLPTLLPQTLRKTLSRTLTQGRTFHSSTPARRVVATSPVKGQEVKVGNQPIHIL